MTACKVDIRPFEETGGTATLIHASTPGIDLATYATVHAAEVQAVFHDVGAIVFRGFDVGGAEGFERVSQALSGWEADYREPSSPRTQVHGRVFTSTDYPAEEEIPLHNENSHCTSWPLKILFHAVLPPVKGGQTPFVDCRKVLASLPSDLVARFEETGWLYVRNFGDALGFDWRTVFRVDTRAGVEAYCEANGMRAEWDVGGDTDTLRVRYVRPAVRTHPRTGERVWFNHGLFFNAFSLSPAIREALLEDFAPDALPYNTFHGDGAPISDGDLQAIQAAYDAHVVQFDWQRGDLVVLDNMRFAHGRRSFEGERRILVTLSEAHSPEEGLP